MMNLILINITQEYTKSSAGTAHKELYGSIISVFSITIYISIISDITRTNIVIVSSGYLGIYQRFAIARKYSNEATLSLRSRRSGTKFANPASPRVCSLSTNVFQGASFGTTSLPSLVC